MIKNIMRTVFIDYEFRNDINFLKNIGFFKQFDIKKLRKIISVIYKKNYLKGEVLYNCGEDVKMLFILKEGQIELFSGSVTKKILPNQFVNQYDIETQQTYTATAKVTEDSLVYVIYKQEFDNLFNTEKVFIFEKINAVFKKVKNVFKK
ncbi:hypothetical protein MASR1M68_02390 [Elusimicrobiota bacterium]